VGREFQYSLVNSQLCALPFNCKIDEFVLGLNFCILNIVFEPSSFYSRITSATFNAKKWNPILHQFLTFDAKNLKLIVKRSWDSTFDAES
jgi:hypothetical protein